MSVVDNFEAMLERGQDSALLRYSLGNEYLKMEKFDKAIHHLAEAVRLDSGYSAAWKLYGRALASVDRQQDAIQAFSRGIRAAEEKGDLQAAKEMRVFRKRCEKTIDA
jgi:predicted Zn-dependent protease